MIWGYARFSLWEIACPFFGWPASYEAEREETTVETNDCLGVAIAFTSCFRWHSDCQMLDERHKTWKLATLGKL